MYVGATAKLRDRIAHHFLRKLFFRHAKWNLEFEICNSVEEAFKKERIFLANEFPPLNHHVGGGGRRKIFLERR